LVPRMKDWVAQYYPNTQIGLTEYNWGAENHINGATTQADIYGILGREGMDMATRWTTPDAATPTFKAMKMYRNYDNQNRGFGETSVAASVPNPDNVSAFAALRAADGALTVMVVNKVGNAQTTALNLSNFNDGGTAQVWQLTSANQITRLADVSVVNGVVNVSLPPQSITLFVIGGATTAPTAPAAPSNLTGTKVANTVTLTWSDNSTDETGFIVERATGTTGNFAEIFRTGANATSYRFTLKKGSFAFRVKAVRGTEVSAASNVVQF
jgi:hypothetical protein